MQKKPLFRWTIGSCIRQGLEILEESIIRTTEALGKDTFDWMICYNGLNKPERDFLKYITKGTSIEIYHQDWADCPIPDNCRSPRGIKGDFEINGKKCGGTLWKTCPPRLRIDTHEIVMDNDIVVLKNIPAVREFLDCKNKCLVLEEPVRFYGVYDSLFDFGEHLNSGLMGFPPSYDFGMEIRKNWENNGKHFNHSQADEQGLLMFTLKKHGEDVSPNIRIKKNFVNEILSGNPQPNLTGNEFAIHFTQANRSPNHIAWLQYLEMTRNNIGMI